MTRDGAAGDDDPGAPEMADVRAAEIALGLAAAGAPEDAALGGEIARWEAAFAGLADDLPAVAPAPGVWSAIRGRIATGAAAPTRAPAIGRVRRLLDSLTLWRGLAGAGLLTAGVLAATLPRTAVAPPVPPAEARTPLIATLRDRDGGALYVVTYDAGRRHAIVVPVAPVARAGRVARLWVVPSPGGAPVALASLTGQGTLTIPVADGIATRIGTGSELAVTLEPASAPLGSESDGILTAHGHFEGY